MDVLVWAFTLSVMLVAAMDVGAQVSGQERRSCFGLRVVLLVLGAPAVLSVLIGGAALHVVPEQTSIVAFVFMVLCSPALLLVPSVLYGPPDTAPGDADHGGGSDPGQPPSPPDRPRGDLPLPDAEPGRWRVRDHRRDLLHARPRRSAPEPERAPVLASLGHQYLGP
jgi:hypothetical protein